MADYWNEQPFSSITSLLKYKTRPRGKNWPEGKEGEGFTHIELNLGSIHSELNLSDYQKDESHFCIKSLFFKKEVNI